MIEISKNEKFVFMIIRLTLVLIFFLMTCNQLVGFPLDKAVMFLYLVGMIMWNIYQGRTVSRNILLGVFAVTAFVATTFLLNLPTSSPIVFFPVLGLFFALLVSEKGRILDLLYWGLFIHLVLGLLFVISSYVFGMNSYVHAMYDKGVPFLHAAQGFTSTVQAYGTLCISWFLIYYWKRDQMQIKTMDNWAFYVVLVCIFCTFNRNTLLIFLVLLFFKQQKVFIGVLVSLAVFYIYYFDFINSVIFNLSTLDSRSDLLQAFRIAFFEQTSWLGYLIGNGNNQVPNEIAKTTVYNTGYIENGTSVLLYTYGFIGYLIYLAAVLILALMFWVRKHVFYAVIVFYIFIIAQQFTHEFFSTTLYLLLAILLLILSKIDSLEQKDSLLSSAE